MLIKFLLNNEFMVNGTVCSGCTASQHCSTEFHSF